MVTCISDVFDFHAFAVGNKPKNSKHSKTRVETRETIDEWHYERVSEITF